MVIFHSYVNLANRYVWSHFQPPRFFRVTKGKFGAPDLVSAHCPKPGGSMWVMAMGPWSPSVGTIVIIIYVAIVAIVVMVMIRLDIVILVII